MGKSIKKMNKMLSEKNPMWKGNKVGYAALHEWISKRKLKPERCEICGKKLPYELANISGEYKRDINDFQWICRICHMESDGRLEQMRIRNVDRETGWFRKCNFCGCEYRVIPSKWEKRQGRYCSKSCSNRGRMIFPEK